MDAFDVSTANRGPAGTGSGASAEIPDSFDVTVASSPDEVEAVLRGRLTAASIGLGKRRQR